MTHDDRTLIAIALTAAIVAAYRIWLRAPAARFHARHRDTVAWVFRPAHMWTILGANAAVAAWLYLR